VRVGHTLTADFDDPNLMSTGGLVPVMALAEQAGLHDLAAFYPPIEKSSTPI
jgi:hypothetical protein